MRNILLIITFFGLLSSCSQSAFKKHVSGSDSLVINFTDSRTESIIKTVSTTEKKAIRRLKQFVDARSSENFKCGYDGHLIFYSGGKQLLPVVFKYKDEGCRHFLFELNGELMSKRISNEAADFLESLEKGALWY